MPCGVCELLGSLCKSLCTSCSFSYKSNNVFIVSSQAELILQRIREPRQGQAQIGDILADREINVLKFEVRGQAERDGQVNQATAIDLVKQAAVKLSEESVDSERDSDITAPSGEPTMSQEEQIARFLAAQYFVLHQCPHFQLIRDKTQTRLDQVPSHPIRKREKDLLLEKIEYVRKYGSLAARLWQTCKTQGATTSDHLKCLQDAKYLTEEQYKYLCSKYDDVGDWDPVIDSLKFIDLDVKIQCIFIEAAEKCSQRFTSFASWQSITPADVSPKGFSRCKPEAVSFLESFKEKETLLDPKENEEFAICKAQAFCLLSHPEIPIRNALEKLTEEEERKILERFEQWKALEPVILHVHKYLRCRIHRSYLLKHAFSQQAIACFTQYNETRSDFLPNLKMSPIPSDPWVLAILFQIADRFDSVEKENICKNAERTLEKGLVKWIARGSLDGSSVYSQSSSPLSIHTVVDPAEILHRIEPSLAQILPIAVSLPLRGKKGLRRTKSLSDIGAEDLPGSEAAQFTPVPLLALRTPSGQPASRDATPLHRVQIVPAAARSSTSPSVPPPVPLQKIARSPRPGYPLSPSVSTHPFSILRSLPPRQVFALHDADPSGSIPNPDHQQVTSALELLGRSSNALSPILEPRDGREEKR